MSAGGWSGAAVAVPIGLAAAPYLSRLTLTVPDRDDPRWYRGRTPSPRRTALTAATVVVLAALAGRAAGLSALLPALLALAVLGAPLCVIDFEVHRLPNRLVHPLAGSALVLLAIAAAVRSEWTDYVRALEGGAAVLAVLFALAFAAPKSFGLGDVRLGAVLGLYLGTRGWSAVYFGIFAGFVLGTVVALALLATGRADRKTPIPFGPMLILGALLVLAFDLTPTVGG